MDSLCLQHSSSAKSQSPIIQSNVGNQQLSKVTLFDSQLVRNALIEARRTREFAQWLRTFRWSFFATGTVKQPVTSDTMLNIVKHWLAPFHQSYAAVILPFGPILQTIHSHMLVGGIGHSGLAETLPRRSWVREGHVRVEQCHPALDSVEYMVEQADEIEILGSPVLYKPRHLRGRRGRR